MLPHPETKAQGMRNVTMTQKACKELECRVRLKSAITESSSAFKGEEKHCPYRITLFSKVSEGPGPARVNTRLLTHTRVSHEPLEGRPSPDT